MRPEMKPFSSHLRTFAGDSRGNVTFWFSLLSVPVFGIAGAALEFGHAFVKKNELQAALDNAVLAGADKYRSTGSSAQTEDAIRQLVITTLSKNGTAVTANGSGETAPVTVSVDQVAPEIGRIAASATYEVKYNFLSLLGLPKTEVYVESAVSVSGNTLELALVLDVTGSMNDAPAGDSKTKLESMKEAAKDFLSIIMPSTLTADVVRVSLTTFSQKVKLDQDTAVAVTGGTATRQVQTGTTQQASTSSYEWVTQSTCRTRYTMLYQQQGQSSSVASSNATAYCQNGSGITTQRFDGTRYYWSPRLVNVPVYGTQYISPCMVERSGSTSSTRYGDAAPSSSSGWTASYGSTQTADVTCPSTAPLIPLTNDRAKIETAVDGLTGNGGTAGHIGTAWGWYTLSPNWTSIWPEGSKPVAYGTRNNFKVVVIMTDGEYNTSYNGTDSTSQARSICTNMKANVVGENGQSEQRVIVYTIGFGIGTNTTARQLLIDCASSENHYFFPYNGDDLRQAFRNIGAALMSGALSARFVN